MKKTTKISRWNWLWGKDRMNVHVTPAKIKNKVK
jgi:hypothetical protein